MFMECFKVLFATILVGWFSSIHASEINPVESMQDMSSKASEGTLPLKKRKGSFLFAPIPTSNPTIGSGLISVGGYFWGQTEEQKNKQSPSFSGLGVLSTNNGSKGIAILHNAYWDEDNWRFTGAMGTADMKLPLLATNLSSINVNVDWDIKGQLAYAQLSRRVFGHWYLGLQGQYINLDQTFSVEIASLNFALPDSIKAVSLGPRVSYDSRDNTTNPRSGVNFSFTMNHTEASGRLDNSYQSYNLSYNSYHAMSDSLILAGRIKGCTRQGSSPLWDSCTLGLRGPVSTEHMGRSSLMGEIESRWQLSERWGLVAFAGAGQINKTLSGRDADSIIPSYGLGLRFMIQKAQRVNFRIDYGQSEDNEGVYISVGETF